MVKIALKEVGKRFNKEWVFKNVNYQLEAGASYAILGANGSGKSTLIQIIAGNITPSAGIITFIKDDEKIPDEKIFREVAIAAPYLELIEEFTLTELIKFHFRFKSMVKEVNEKDIPELLNLGLERNKPLKHYSSGMAQRVKLGLAIFSDCPVLLLDEPATNLDNNGISWYNDLIKKYAGNRLVVVCSNHRTDEYSFCKEELIMENFK